MYTTRMKRFLRAAAAAVTRTRTVTCYSSFLWRRSATSDFFLFSSPTTTTKSSAAMVRNVVAHTIGSQRQQSTNMNPAESIPATEANSNKDMVPELDEFTRKIANRLLSGDRSALSKAITIVESKRYEDHLRAQALLFYVTSQCKEQRSNTDANSNRYDPSVDRESFRIGISGPPGAGNYHIHIHIHK